jgi:outer membrane protein OmpA-like peptidoglycan-associated protein
VSALPARVASADPLRWHLEAGGALPLGEPQAHEYGVGLQGSFAPELPLGRSAGLQLEAGGLWLSHTNPPSDPSIADHGDGEAFTLMGGVRLHPFTVVAGLWLDANLGYVRSGSLDRFGFDAHLGYDWRVGEGRWDVGPYVGYLQVVQPSDALRPQDAHILSIGIHVALGGVRPPPPVVVEEPPPPPPPPPPPTPPPPPATPPDRDGDGVPDGEDACPDVPGVHTEDPKTNGCPPAGDQVRVVEDHIEYDDVILFDTDSPHVHRASWPILEKLAKFIVANPDIQQLDISGHADERGAADHNLQLSRFRAEAVKYLLVKFGVDPARVTTIGYGYAHPRSTGHTEKDWRQNRRVDFIVTKVRNAQGGTTTLPQAAPSPQSPPAAPAPGAPAPSDGGKP